jgi:beta-glucosidase
LSDFIGINYYTRDMIRFALSPGSLFGKQELAPGAETNELGWELYPEGLSRLIHRYWKRYRLPILITENGTCDAQDAIRPRYLVDHLEIVARAIEGGADVEGYFHWSLMDNFEWVEGLSARFGLYEVDYETQERRLRESGKLYAEIARSGGASPELLSAYGL